MRFSTTLLAVRDMNRSLEFYKTFFDQDVECDLGWNKLLTCGLALQEHFDKLCGFSEDKMHFGAHNMELYFETEDMDGFMKLLSVHPEVKRLHELKQYEWKQHVIRIFDPDGHIIEIGESMESVAFKEFDAGHSLEETAELMQHPIDLVKKWHENYLARKEK